MESTTTLESELTRCRRALSKSREAGRRFRELFELMPEVCCLAEIVHDDQGRPGFHFLEANRAFATLAGLPPEQVRGMKSRQLPYLQPLCADAFARLSPSGEPVRFENYAEGLDKWFSVLAYGLEPGRFAFQLTDITERKRTERETLEQFKLADVVFTHSMSSIAVLDADYNFLRVNEAYARATRRTVSEFPGRNHFEMFPSDAELIFNDVKRTKQPHTTFTRAFKFPDQPERGETYWDWTLYPVLDEGGEVEYLVLSLVDVTERKLAEEALRESEARSRQQAAELELIYTTAPIGLCVLNRELRYIHINERLAEINGLPAGDHLGKTVREVVPAEIADRIEPLLKHVLSTGRPELGFDMITGLHQGVPRHWAAQFWPLKFAEGDVFGVNVVVEEVTERKRLEESWERERKFRTLAENSTDLVVRFDRDLRQVYVNPAIETLFGGARLPDELAKEFYHPLQQVFATGRLRNVESRVSTAAGERYLDSCLVPERGVEGEVETVLSITHDVTQHKLAQQELEALALQDPLTGIGNRRYLERLVEREWRRETRHRHWVALIMIDIDYFKSYNDYYGHPTGDECLRRVADALRRSLHRPDDTLVRYGGEEFAVLLTETRQSSAQELAERLRQAVEDLDLPHANSPMARVTVSLGVSAIKAHKGDFPTLIENADAALYRAKDKGRNRVEAS